MRFPTSAALGFVLVMASAPLPCRAADDYKPGPDSLPQAGVAKGELVKGQYTAKEGSEFPGTERDYTIYLPPGLDKKKPSPFMVFQDGVIYQAPTVFDNLIAKKEIPPLIGIFIRPGVAPAPNANALPRFNRSYEYDSVTPAYSHFLIDEFLPEIAKKHGLKLSEKGDDAAIAGNSSGGICAFMVAWHRPDRFRRVFTGVGTYVGIHGADQLPVLVRKMEPKPLRVYLQSGTGDNNLYCGDWWMANQMMERSLTWAGYDVNHIWGEGGHNAKHATAIFPEALKWLWRGWPEEGLRANPGNTSKWLGYSVLDKGGWTELRSDVPSPQWDRLRPNHKGEVLAYSTVKHPTFALFSASGDGHLLKLPRDNVRQATWADGDDLVLVTDWLGTDAKPQTLKLHPDGSVEIWAHGVIGPKNDVVITNEGTLYSCDGAGLDGVRRSGDVFDAVEATDFNLARMILSPDQTLLYAIDGWEFERQSVWIWQIQPDGKIKPGQGRFFQLESPGGAEGMCADTDGRLYVATWRNIQVCDQAGRVNFIIPIPEPRDSSEHPRDICFGGKDLSELYIACGKKIYKRAMKTHGIVSGQMAPIKPAAPHL